MIKLNALNIENFIKELQERSINEVRFSFCEKTEGRGDYPFTSISIKLTSVQNRTEKRKQELMIYIEELVGSEIPYFKSEMEGVRKKAEKRGEEVKKILKDKGLEVKDGVYEE